MQPRFVASQTQEMEAIEYNGGGSSIRIMAQNISSANFISNSNVVIHTNPAGEQRVPQTGVTTSDPSPPPPGTLSDSGSEIDGGDVKILRKNKLPLEKWEKLAKNLGLTDGEAADLKLRHQGLAELCCRLLEFWQEKESTEATKRRLAHALWMADEKDLAVEIK